MLFLKSFISLQDPGSLLETEVEFELDKETVIETARIYFDNVSEVVHTFVETFVGVPAVTAAAEEEDLNVYITSITTENITVNTSDVFTGYVDIHAIYVAV